MKLLLKDFQEDAVVKLVRHLRGAARDSRSGDRQSVCLSSTTGSGKTVMLTRAIELILQGDEEQAPIPDATFLWITDQPELNEQTRKKMLATSSLLNHERLISIDATFDSETLWPGAVHFLNIQKLGKDKGLVSQSDKRTYSIWEIIRNTIDARPGQFFVIIDEAHRGMIEENGQAEALTIIQKFIKGAPGELPPVPVVVGISATPERFNRLIVGTGRMNRPVDVDVADVRASGLIKNMIVLHHPLEEQPTDMTMLREAARSFKMFGAHWSSYCAMQEESEVLPLLVVQVEDAGGKGQISETDIAQGIHMLRDVLGSLPSDAFAHSFQEGTTLNLGGEDIRYLAPSEIEGDPDVRIVFFKTSLNTGWDCPRAEVMMSFRSATDSTYIAQLVGRMVRTPLARRIVDDEVLNTVALFLPHYDAKGLEGVITKLSKPDDGGIAPIDVEKGEDVVELNRAAGTDQLFEVLAALPSYLVPRKRKANQVRRLMKLARLLTNGEIDDNALTAGKAALLGVLNAEYNRCKHTRRFREVVEERGQIEIEAVNWEVGTEAVRKGGSVRVDIASENVEDLFEATGRKLNEGLHKVWWRDRVRDAPADRERAKLELFALCIEPDVIRKIEKVAQETVQQWLRAHESAIARLEEGKRAAYGEVRNLAANPELSPLVYPATIQGKQADTTFKKHLYVTEGNLFPADLNKSETEILEKELSPRGVVAWLRNVDRKPWALCVPYEVEGEDRPMYPDFLIIRSVEGRFVVDIIEPHSITFADAPAKAAGLAKFAAKHSDQFGRIELVMLDGKISKRLDLTDEIVRSKVKGIKLPEQLRKLFDES
jgi:type III restriction enzyme